MVKDGLIDKALNNNSLVNEVYKDTLQPSLKKVGKVGEDILRFVALPFTFLGLTAEQLEEKYKKFITDSISKVPEEKRKRPKSVIASPLLEHVKYLFDDEEGSDDLIKMFSDLLANASNTDMRNDVHASFVYTLLQLGSVEAEIMHRIYSIDDYDIIGVTFREKQPQDKGFLKVLSNEAEPLLSEDKNVFYYYNVAIIDNDIGVPKEEIHNAINILEHHNLISSFRMNKYKDKDEYSLERHDKEHLEEFNPYEAVICYNLTQYGVDFMNACKDPVTNPRSFFVCTKCNTGFMNNNRNAICPTCGSTDVKL